MFRKFLQHLFWLGATENRNSVRTFSFSFLFFPHNIKKQECNKQKNTLKNSDKKETIDLKALAYGNVSVESVQKLTDTSKIFYRVNT